VAPNTFLTFEGKTYRLVDLLQADLVAAGDFTRVGQAARADIEQADLTVYRKAGDDQAVYTYAPPVSPQDATAAAAEDDTTAPALWYRWLREP